MTEEQSTNKTQVNINLDTTPIYYTDKIGITANSDGIVLDVMQRIGTTNKIRIVSRIGMSKTHAKRFIEELGKLVAMTNVRKSRKAN